MHFLGDLRSALLSLLWSPHRPQWDPSAGPLSSISTVLPEWVILELGVEITTVLSSVRMALIFLSEVRLIFLFLLDSVDGDGVLLHLVDVGLGGAQLDLGLAGQDGDVLHPVDLLGQYHHGVVIVTGAVRGRHMLA